MSACQCDGAQRARALPDRGPLTFESNDDGETVCRFCWSVLSSDWLDDADAPTLDCEECAEQPGTVAEVRMGRNLVSLRLCPICAALADAGGRLHVLADR